MLAIFSELVFINQGSLVLESCYILFGIPFLRRLFQEKAILFLYLNFPMILIALIHSYETRTVRNRGHQVSMLFQPKNDTTSYTRDHWT